MCLRAHGIRLQELYANPLPTTSPVSGVGHLRTANVDKILQIHLERLYGPTQRRAEGWSQKLIVRLAGLRRTKPQCRLDQADSDRSEELTITEKQ